MDIAFSSKFKKQFKKLPAKVQMRFSERLDLLLEDERHPLLNLHSLTGQYRDRQSFNVNADIRAVFAIKDDNTIYFSAIGSHSELYS